MKKITWVIMTLTFLATPFYSAYADNPLSNNPYVQQIQYVNQIISDINNQNYSLNSQYAQSAIQQVWNNYIEAFKNPAEMIATPQFTQVNTNNMFRGHNNSTMMPLQKNNAVPVQQNNFYQNTQPTTNNNTQQNNNAVNVPPPPPTPNSSDSSQKKIMVHDPYRLALLIKH